VITLDTSGLIAIVNPVDSRHEEVISILRAEPGPRLVPAAILAEIAYILERRAGTRLLLRFVQDLESNAYTLDCGEENLSRIYQLVDRYQDLPLGLADAAVIACAERHGTKVLTLDHHFAVVAREGTITVLPASY
jgi:predicted nucleic acid-binding protein